VFSFGRPATLGGRAKGRAGQAGLTEQNPARIERPAYPGRNFGGRRRQARALLGGAHFGKPCRCFYSLKGMRRARKPTQAGPNCQFFPRFCRKCRADLQTSPGAGYARGPSDGADGHSAESTGPMPEPSRALPNFASTAGQGPGMAESVARCRSAWPFAESAGPRAYPAPGETFRANR
jgi:hypothetical protein